MERSVVTFLLMRISRLPRNTSEMMNAPKFQKQHICIYLAEDQRWRVSKSWPVMAAPRSLAMARSVDHIKRVMLSGQGRNSGTHLDPKLATVKFQA